MTSGLAGGGCFLVPGLPCSPISRNKTWPLPPACLLLRAQERLPGSRGHPAVVYLASPVSTPPQHPWGGPLSPVHRKLKHRAWWVQSRESNLRVSPHG